MSDDFGVSRYKGALQAILAIDRAYMESAYNVARYMLDKLEAEKDPQMKVFLEEFIRRVLPQMVQEFDAVRKVGIEPFLRAEMRTSHERLGTTGD